MNTTISENDGFTKILGRLSALALVAPWIIEKKFYVEG